MKNQILLFIILILMLSNSCEKENKQIIPELFKKYVDTFFEEAAARGLDIHLKDFDLEILLTDIDDPRTMGNCDMNSHKINIDEGKWERLNEVDKEFLIFHELGHCILDRFHKNEKTDNEECLSYMKGDEDSFKCSMNKNSEIWRSFYLDELFDDQQKLPNWYTENKTYNNIFKNYPYDYNIIDTLSNELFISGLEFVDSEDYAIEIKYNDWKNIENAIYLGVDNVVLGYCDMCTVGKVSIIIGSNRVYSGDNISFSEEETILTIHKIGNLINFYVNKRFIHTFENQNQNTLNIQTRYHDTPMKMSLKIQRQ